MTSNPQPATLVECSACNARISKEASSCPYCGLPFKNKIGYWRDMWVPLLSLVLGLASVLNTSYNSYNETRLKRFEVTFRIKQEAYAAFMQSIAEAFDSARSNSARGESIRYLSSAQTSYFALEPFIDDANVRSSFLNQMEDYKAFLLGVMSNGGQAVETFNDRRERFRDTLFPILFKE